MGRLDTDIHHFGPDEDLNMSIPYANRRRKEVPVCSLGSDRLPGALHQHIRLSLYRSLSTTESVLEDREAERCLLVGAAG